MTLRRWTGPLGTGGFRFGPRHEPEEIVVEHVHIEVGSEETVFRVQRFEDGVLVEDTQDEREV